MQFLKTKDSSASFLCNTLKTSKNTSALFIHENEQMNKTIILEPDTHLRLFSIYGKNTEIMNTFSVSENCTLEMHEIFYGNANVKNIIPIEKPNSILNLIAKGIVKKNESSSYETISFGGKEAKNSVVSIEEHAYMLDKNANISLVPGLEIINNEINARHASGISQLDEEQLFYLMSRGFCEEEAKKEIISGFIFSEYDTINKLFNYKLLG